MQIFVQLPSGKTVSVDCSVTTTVADVLNFVNLVHNSDLVPLSVCWYKRAFYEQEHPMTVVPGSVLSNETRLVDLYVHGVIKEITLMAVH